MGALLESLIIWIGPIVGGALISVATNLVSRVLAALGMGVVAYTGMTATLGWLKTNVAASFTSLPPVAVGILSLMQVGPCVSMLCSAILIRLTFMGMTSDTVKSWVKR